MNESDRNTAGMCKIIPMPREYCEFSGTSKASITELKDASVAAEGYRLEITPEKIIIVSSDERGAFYARATLSQLMNADGSYQCAKIADAPEFPYRGIMIDEGRHFFGKEHMLKHLELMARYKFNTLHWHLTEDQGWRIQIDKYPELTTYGATRVETAVRGRYTGKYDGTKYGPFFYTKADIREIVERANELHIDIIPEIEVPGHTRSIIAAYPELACCNADLGPRRTCWTDWGICDDVICASNPKVLQFYKDVFDEVCEMFPYSKTIHFGGDECTGRQWAKCPDCQAKMKELGFEKVIELQGWLVGQLYDYIVEKKGRRVAGYGAMLHSGRKPDPAHTLITVGCENAYADYAMQGYDCAVAQLEYCYWDFDQGLDNDPNVYGTWWPGSVSASIIYGYDPRRGLPKSASKHILGGEAHNWSEYTYSVPELQWKIWPRALALSQAFWNPQSGYSYREWFVPVAKEHIAKLRAEGINCADISGFGLHASTGGESADNQVLELE